MKHNYLEVFDYLKQDSSENILKTEKNGQKEHKSGNHFPLKFFQIIST